jgi:hypothetical protein
LMPCHSDVMQQCVTSVSQCYDAACLPRAIAETRSRAMDGDATIGRLSAWSGGRDASLHRPPSHVDKRHGDVNTSVFVLVTTRIPCGRATW